MLFVWIVTEHGQTRQHLCVSVCGCSQGGAGAGGPRDDGGVCYRAQHSRAEASPRLRAPSPSRRASDLSGRFVSFS